VRRGGKAVSDATRQARTRSGVRAGASVTDALRTCAVKTRTDAHGTLQRIVDDLETDELRVLTEIAERLRQGTRIQGVLHLARDRRDFHEGRARAEVLDLLATLACAWLCAGGAP
jgi:hypothetical protein